MHDLVVTHNEPGHTWLQKRPEWFNQGGDTIEKALTHQTIAQMIGASRETVSRAMKDFQDANWVTVERRRITISDRVALEQRAQARV